MNITTVDKMHLELYYCILIVSVAGELCRNVYGLRHLATIGIPLLMPFLMYMYYS